MPVAICKTCNHSAPISHEYSIRIARKTARLVCAKCHGTDAKVVDAQDIGRVATPQKPALGVRPSPASQPTSGTFKLGALLQPANAAEPNPIKAQLNSAIIREKQKLEASPAIPKAPPKEQKRTKAPRKTKRSSFRVFRDKSTSVKCGVCKRLVSPQEFSAHTATHKPGETIGNLVKLLREKGPGPKLTQGNSAPPAGSRNSPPIQSPPDTTTPRSSHWQTRCASCGSPDLYHDCSNIEMG